MYKLWLWFVIGLVLAYSSWWAWYGGWFWGARFFVFASIPASFALAVRLRNPSQSLFANLLTLFVLGYSLWVGIDGALFDQLDLGNTCIVHNYVQEHLCHYNPRYSVLWRPFEVRLTLSNHEKVFILFSLLIFVYLAVPLLVVIAKQIVTQLQEMRMGVLNWRVWHI